MLELFAMNQRAILRQLLKTNGYNVTAARQTVFQALQKLGPAQLTQLQQHTQTSVHRASVYRTIVLFEFLGIVRRIPHGWKHKFELSDAFNEHHHHAHCLRCDRITTLPENNQLEAAIQHTAASAAFTVKEHTLEIHGICHNCQK